MAKGIGRDDWEGAWVPFLGLQGCRRDWFYMKKCMKKNKSSGLLVGPDVI